MDRYQRIALILGVCVTVASVAAAYWARYALVEVDGLEAYCAQAAREFRCTLRMAVIAAFQQHRLGGAAILLAALAFWTRRGSLALLALAVAGTGLVLYDADVSAVAWIAAALTLQRAATGQQTPAPV